MFVCVIENILYGQKNQKNRIERVDWLDNTRRILRVKISEVQGFDIKVIHMV